MPISRSTVVITHGAFDVEGIPSVETLRRW